MRTTLARVGAVVAALAVIGVAWAHGPTRQKVRESIEINAPPAKVWAVIGNFQDMSWLQPVSKTEGAKSNEIEATRRLTLADGATVDEELYKYDAEKMTYFGTSAKFIDTLRKSGLRPIDSHDLSTVRTISSVVRVTSGIIMAPSAAPPASAEKCPNGRTRNCHAKMPMTIDGRPLSTSARNRTRLASFVPPRSAR